MTQTTATDAVRSPSTVRTTADADAVRPFRAPFVPLVPIVGILTCLLLMFSLPAENWLRLGVWLLIGFLIYFGYGRKHSIMARYLAHEITAHGVSPWRTTGWSLPPAKVLRSSIFRGPQRPSA